jgi:diamine N-acetyltransferase
MNSFTGCYTGNSLPKNCTKSQTISKKKNNFHEVISTQMKFSKIIPDSDLLPVVKVLNEAHGTVAKEFGFTKQNNPTNNAFIDIETLRAQLIKGIELFQLSFYNKPIGCIAIEKSAKETDTYYIEKVSVIPEYRHYGYGVNLMDYAIEMIKKSGGRKASIALIDSNVRLKNWYMMQGYKETGIKDFSHLPFRVCFMSRQLY